MAYSVKDELEYLIMNAKVAGKTEANNPMVKTLIRAKGVITTLENRLAGQLTARDQIALQMLSLSADSDDGVSIGEAFQLADLFIEASKEVNHG